MTVNHVEFPFRVMDYKALVLFVVLRSSKHALKRWMKLYRLNRRIMAYMTTTNERRHDHFQVNKGTDAAPTQPTIRKHHCRSLKTKYPITHKTPNTPANENSCSSSTLLACYERVYFQGRAQKNRLATSAMVLLQLSPLPP